MKTTHIILLLLSALLASGCCLLRPPADPAAPEYVPFAHGGPHPSLLESDPLYKDTPWYLRPPDKDFPPEP